VVELSKKSNDELIDMLLNSEHKYYVWDYHHDQHLSKMMKHQISDEYALIRKEILKRMESE
jgi:REP element-mobilizing transposase RayT